jgi:predicted RND superfamily exporter protein
LSASPVTTLIANVTAAIGFGVLYFTGSELLMQFGGVAALNVMFTWLMCLCLIPIIFSYLPIPKGKANTVHVPNFLDRLLKKTDELVQQKSLIIYLHHFFNCCFHNWHLQNKYQWLCG